MKSLRSGRRNAALIVLTLSVGMAATTLVFSVLDTMLLRPLPYGGADRLSFLWSVAKRGSGQFELSSPARFMDLKRETKSFAAMGAFYGENMNLSSLPGGQLAAPERLSAVRYLPGFFEALGTGAALGRLPSKAEEINGGPKAAVVTWEFWQNRLGGRTEALNKTMDLSGSQYELVGVLPRGFRFPSKKAELFAPGQLYGGLYEQRAAQFVSVLALRRVGVTLAVAEAEVEQSVRGMGERFGPVERDLGVRFEDARSYLVGANTQRSIWILSAAVGLLLAIAAVNAGNLMLARGMDRQRDQAVRLALGARPFRMLLDTVLEGLVLSAIAAAVGTTMSVWGLDVLRSYWKLLPTFLEINIDWRVAAASLGIAGAVGILASLGPGLVAARRDVLSSLRGNRVTSRGGWRKALVSVQIALSMVLLAGAFWMGQHLQGLLRVDPGFRTSGLTTFQVTLPWETSFVEQIAFFRGLRLNFAESGLVEKVAYADGMPGEATIVNGFRGTSGKQSVRLARVSANYFDVLGIGVLRGRAIAERDTAKTQRVAVLNERAAALLFPGVDAVGKTLMSPYGLVENPVAVVGIVKGADKPVVYEGFQTTNWPSPSFFVEARGGQGAAMLVDLRNRLKQERAGQALHSVVTIERYLENQVAEPKLSFFLVGLFAVGAGLVSFLGIYGVMSWYVSERTVEIGVRVALGARTTQVLGMVARQGVLFVLVGIAAGIALSIAAARAAGVEISWMSVGFAGSGILILSAIAMSGPAIRAIRIEPREALRGDG